MFKYSFIFKFPCQASLCYAGTKQQTSAERPTLLFQESSWRFELSFIIILIFCIYRDLDGKFLSIDMKSLLDTAIG